MKANIDERKGALEFNRLNSSRDRTEHEYEAEDLNIVSGEILMASLNERKKSSLSKKALNTESMEEEEDESQQRDEEDDQSGRNKHGQILGSSANSGSLDPLVKNLQISRPWDFKNPKTSDDSTSPRSAYHRIQKMHRPFTKPTHSGDRPRESLESRSKPLFPLEGRARTGKFMDNFSSRKRPHLEFEEEPMRITDPVEQIIHRVNQPITYNQHGSLSVNSFGYEPRLKQNRYLGEYSAPLYRYDANYDSSGRFSANPPEDDQPAIVTEDNTQWAERAVQHQDHARQVTVQPSPCLPPPGPPPPMQSDEDEGTPFVDKDRFSVKVLESMDGSSQKRYQCSFCKKIFRQRYNVVVHIRTHTGEKPHKCKFCGRGFAQKSNLKRHERAHMKRQVAGHLPSMQLRTPYYADMLGPWQT
eukprot:CAMPEP_0184479576 /NCGR_PEP_ID=MMETSP0113_2-20130426/1250_1 /TAXON_ID=91329 /ORGANISM="Norrisiella sphaerica, Strain BC52" /LENGTH=414 /DNA_ID=CAMNT_0026857695 /DNA_START=159 /DNA_END=1403 /DNA_ORIENTATION=-